MVQVISSTISTVGTPAFSATGPDILVVDANGKLVATSAPPTGGPFLPPGQVGAVLTGPWTAVIDGLVQGDAGGLEIIAASSTDNSVVTVGTTGKIIGIGLATGIAGSADILNAGTISSSTGIGQSSGHSIVNSGLIESTSGVGIDIAGAGFETIANSGTINSSTTVSISVHDGAEAHIDNSGTLSGRVVLAGATLAGQMDVLTNTGDIQGNGPAFPVIGSGPLFGVISILSQDNAYIFNLGTIDGAVVLDAGTHTIRNEGTMQHSAIDTYAIAGDGVFGTNAINNKGTIDGSIIDSGATDSTLSSSLWHIANSGTINGDVLLGDQNDVVTEAGIGHITGKVFLGRGNNTFIGNATSETVVGGGNDHVALGGGNDTFIAGPEGLGKSAIIGGSGNDTFDGNNADYALRINLSLQSVFSGPSTIAAQSVNGASLVNFENAKGGFKNDMIIGSSAANVIEGGHGADALWGGGGNDTFVFKNASDSGLTAATRDRIFDFSHGHDKLDVSALGAGLHFIGASGFSSTAGEIDAHFNGTQTIVSADLNGDGQADFAVGLVGHIQLTIGDFIL